MGKHPHHLEHIIMKRKHVSVMKSILNNEMFRIEFRTSKYQVREIFVDKILLQIDSKDCYYGSK